MGAVLLVQPIRREYFDVVSEEIRNAHTRVWVNMFIVDARIGVDDKAQVLALLTLLQQARKRGVNARLLIGDSRTSPDIFLCTRASAKIAALLGIDLRQYRLTKTRSTHVKYLVIDDAISIIGSHNWEPGAFGRFVEDSVCITSRLVNSELRRDFEKDWRNGRRVEAPASCPVEPPSPGVSKEILVREYPADSVRLVIDGTYPRIAKGVLDGATSSIDIKMFYMTFPKRVSAVSKLVSCIIDAHKRGVRTRVLLDRDRPDDVYGSRYINAAAFQELRANGVPVHYDSRSRVTHSKLIIVDGRRVLVGSHNWTESSMTRYHEVSALIDSVPLARNYSTDFEKCWRLSVRP
jgi:phosphatidylserine/phosphatidylglycerophosphate/cardiolipin synthase-like enzyme